MTETTSELKTILYKDEDYVYGINTKHQFIILRNDFIQVPDIVTNINSDYSFCMDGSTMYMCTNCDSIRQILRFNHSSVPEPMFTEQVIPFLTNMIYFNGYICANSDVEIYIYHVASNKRIVQPMQMTGSYQGIAGYNDRIYVKYNQTSILSIPFQNGILYYNFSQVLQTGPFALYFQLDQSIYYSNILITLPIGNDTIQVGFDETTVKDEQVPYISLTSNPTFYDLEGTLTYQLPHSYTDLIICGTVCFLSGSMVITDQGPISIEYLVPSVHTIHHKKIIGISITYSLEDTLVCIQKNSFQKHVPFKDTFMSNNHKIYYNGKFLEAGQLIGQKGVYEVPYENQLLYNVILKEHSVMNVNNLICETLDPNNPVAKKFII